MASCSGACLKRLRHGKGRAALFQIDPANLQTTVASQPKLRLALLKPATTGPNVTTRAGAVDRHRKAISQKEFDDSKSALETAETTLRQVHARRRLKPS